MACVNEIWITASDNQLEVNRYAGFAERLDRKSFVGGAETTCLRKDIVVGVIMLLFQSHCIEQRIIQ